MYTYNYEYSSSGAEMDAAVGGALAVFMVIYLLVGLAIFVLMLISQWMIFKKAGKHGWAALIPIYNTYVMIEVAKLQWWYLLLMFIPVANIFATFMIYIKMAENFGRSTAFGVLSVFFPVICFPIMAFSKDKYIGDKKKK